MVAASCGSSSARSDCQENMLQGEECFCEEDGCNTEAEDAPDPTTDGIECYIGAFGVTRTLKCGGGSSTCQSLTGNARSVIFIKKHIREN